MVKVVFNFIDDFFLEVFWLFEFCCIEIDFVGLYFSFNDFVICGGCYVYFGFGVFFDQQLFGGILCDFDYEGNNYIQYGVNFCFLVFVFVDIEFGFFFVNYYSCFLVISVVIFIGLININFIGLFIQVFICLGFDLIIVVV